MNYLNSFKQFLAVGILEMCATLGILEREE
jgi:hypothetical protein